MTFGHAKDFSWIGMAWGNSIPKAALENLPSLHADFSAASRIFFKVPRIPREGNGGSTYIESTIIVNALRFGAKWERARAFR